MRLPSPLYEAVRDAMKHHGAWHYARYRETWVPVPDRPAWQKARNLYPNLKYSDEAGAGDEFLRFHRMMLQHFNWLVQNTPGSTYVFAPWTDLPAWLQARFGPGFLASMNQALPGYIAGNASDALGGFIECTALFAFPGSEVHNLAHGYLATYEAAKFPNDPMLADADMSDFSQAHHNQHFWELHGWIDEMFASWQRNNGEVVDQSPMDPGAHDMGGMMNMHKHGKFSPVPDQPAFEPTPGLRDLGRRTSRGRAASGGHMQVHVRATGPASPTQTGAGGGGS